MTQMVNLDIPSEPALLQALGRLAVAHGNLEMVQIMCLKTLTGLAPDKALEKFRGKTAKSIREKIENIIVEHAGQGQEKRVNGFKELLLDARCASSRRNAFLHRFWAYRDDGEWVTSADESHWEPLPAVAAIEDLIAFIQTTTARLNKERFEGGLIYDLAGRASASEHME
jgi:hypothetical protein